MLPLNLSLQTPSLCICHHQTPPGKSLGIESANLPINQGDWEGVEGVASSLMCESKSGNDTRGEGGYSVRAFSSFGRVGVGCGTLSGLLKPNHQFFRDWIVDFLLGSNTTAECLLKLTIDGCFTGRLGRFSSLATFACFAAVLRC